MLTNQGSKLKVSLIVGLCFIGLALVTVFIYFTYFLDKNEDLKDKTSTLDVIEFTFEEDGKTYKVINLAENNQRWLFVNDEQSSLLSAIPSTPTSHLTLPETSKSHNLTKTATKLDSFTYETTLTKSAEHINYLKSQGYKVIRQVEARNYIEVILANPKEKEPNQRIIIQENLILFGEIEKNSLLPSIDDYLQSYRITGGEKK